MASKPTKERTDVIMGPRYGWQTKRVRKPGKSPNMGPGLHRTNMVGHDPLTRGGDRYDAGASVLSGVPVPKGTLASKLNSPYDICQDDALRQRGPPGPLARTHRG